VPESWNPEIYRQREQRWREKVEAIPPGKERDACVSLADGYAHLAQLLADDASDQAQLPPAVP
jgi:hypothetical protein